MRVSVCVCARVGLCVCACACECVCVYMCAVANRRWLIVTVMMVGVRMAGMLPRVDGAVCADGYGGEDGEDDVVMVREKG